MSFRILLFGDMHCGHELGLTHPHWWREDKKEYQERFWNDYIEVLKKVGKVDLAVGMGDLIDGPGTKDTTHHIETDLNEQVDMAIAAVKEIKADKMFFIRGTGYHTDYGMCVEDLIARHFRVPIYDKKVLNIGSKKFGFKHKLVRSTTPYGKSTPLVKAIVSSILSGKPIDYQFFAHVHYYVDGGLQGRRAFSIPCLQCCGPTNSKFARGLDDGQYDVGVLEIVCYNDGGIREIYHYIDNGG